MRLLPGKFLWEFLVDSECKRIHTFSSLGSWEANRHLEGVRIYHESHSLRNVCCGLMLAWRDDSIGENMYCTGAKL